MKSETARVSRMPVAFILILAATVMCHWYRYSEFDPMTSPSFTHPLGTDHLGRDLTAELVLAAIYSFLASFLASSVALCIGVCLGAGATLSHSEVPGKLLVAVRDIEWSLSGLFLAFIIALLVGGGEAVVIVVMALIQWPSYAEVAESRGKEVWRSSYVDAERAIGASRAYIIMYTVIPDLVASCALILPSRLVEAWVVELSLNYLGLGAQPGSPSLGRMLMQATSRNLSGGPVDIAVMAAVTILGLALGAWALSRQLGQR